MAAQKHAMVAPPAIITGFAAAMSSPSLRPGRVALVGAGPGDPDLLTVKAQRLIQHAETVVYDRLVSPEIMALPPPSATLIYAGKQAANHPLPQSEINALLINLARSGRSVLRLKGGDPFVFGRGSEEAEALARAGIAFEVVPGISSASGCATYGGIPLTHRGLANNVRLLTGHWKEGEALDYDWTKLADPDGTLAIYMGLTHLPDIAARLIAAGLAPDTPAAAIASGTTPRQRRLLGTLATLPALAAEKGLKPPTLIIIGKVVGLAETLDWFGGP